MKKKILGVLILLSILLIAVYFFKANQSHSELNLDERPKGLKIELSPDDLRKKIIQDLGERPKKLEKNP